MEQNGKNLTYSVSTVSNKFDQTGTRRFMLKFPQQFRHVSGTMVAEVITNGPVPIG